MFFDVIQSSLEPIVVAGRPADIRSGSSLWGVPKALNTENNQETPRTTENNTENKHEMTENK